MSNVEFSLIQKDNVQILEWKIVGGVLKYEELPILEQKLEKIIPKIRFSKPTVLSGRAPHWMYAVLVHNLHYAQILATYEPRLSCGIIISAPSDDYLGMGIDIETGEIFEAKLGAKGQPVISYVRFPDIQVIAFKIEKDRIIEPEMILPVVREIRRAFDEYILDSSIPIMIYGLMPIWMGQAIVVETVHRTPYLCFYDPRLRGGVIVASHIPAVKIGTLFPLTSEDINIIRKSLENQPLQTVCVGILGAPNSGKSVFLHMLNLVLREMGLTTLTQEADLFAPTQEWSIYAPEIRKILKSLRNPEEVLKWVIDSLKNLRDHSGVDIVLVDLGGGKPKNGEWEFITRENYEILKYIDYVIICSRNDEMQINKIIRELREKTPHIKIVAILESIYPDKEGRYAYFDKELRTGAISYLDREGFKRKEIPETSWNVVRQVAELLLEDIKRDFQ